MAERVALRRVPEQAMNRRGIETCLAQRLVLFGWLGNLRESHSNRITPSIRRPARRRRQRYFLRCAADACEHAENRNHDRSLARSRHTGDDGKPRAYCGFHAESLLGRKSERPPIKE